MADEKLKEQFYKVLDEIESPDGTFMHTDIEAQDFRPELKYPRENFISDIKRIISSYDSKIQTDMTGFFGFVIEKNTDGISTIKGYPSVINLDKDDAPPEVVKIFNCVKRFSEDNEVIVKNNKTLTGYLNIVIKALPEFLTLIGKVQHKTHSYSVDVHTLKVLQGVMQNPKYTALPKEDRRVLQIAVLLHDITKKEGEIDKSHPACGAKDAGFILNKLALAPDVKDRICLIIKNHDWLERYNKGITSVEDFAAALKNGNDFLMLAIMAEADLKAVRRCGEFYERYKDVLDRGVKEISAVINNHLSAA